MGKKIIALILENYSFCITWHGLNETQFVLHKIYENNKRLMIIVLFSKQGKESVVKMKQKQGSFNIKILTHMLGTCMVCNKNIFWGKKLRICYVRFPEPLSCLCYISL